MKIAISTEESMVAPHFGRCPEYTIYNVVDGSVADKTLFLIPDMNRVSCLNTCQN